MAMHISGSGEGGNGRVHPVADPVFPRRGGGEPIREIGSKAYYLARFFAENYMKMKEIRPRLRASPVALPPDPTRGEITGSSRNSVWPTLC